MDRFGGWWRPWHYGDAVSEYWAVREGVSIGDVSTLGKLVVSGPGRRRAARADLPVPRRGHQAGPVALRAAAQRARPRHGRRDDPARVARRGSCCRSRPAAPPTPRCGCATGSRSGASTSTSSTGRCRWPRSTSPGRWPRSCCSAPAWPSRRGSSATSTPTSPACHATSCACRSPARPPSSSTTRSTARSSCGGRCWTSGADLGIRPHGLQALFGLRLEKGHVIVGMDTELDTTPRRLGMDWAVRMEKPRFIGRASLERTAKLPDHRRWVGLHDGRRRRRPRARRSGRTARSSAT